MMIGPLKSLIKTLLPRYQTLHLEYRVDMQPRYGHGRPPHAGLNTIIGQHSQTYAQLLHEALAFREHLVGIPEASRATGPQPGWNNGFLPGLDMVMLYTLIAAKRPARYVEIGSGNSTKVVHQARTEHQVPLTITSIDPFPRAEIDSLADIVIRTPFEQSDLAWVRELDAGDVVFVDNSHRVFPNSDATAFFLDVLPNLAPGVLVQVHDVYLPFDYPQAMCDRYYSEQYMLAAMILANPIRYRPLMPNYFVSEDAGLKTILEPLWTDARMPAVERHGGSFWLVIGD